MGNLELDFTPGRRTAFQTQSLQSDHTSHTWDKFIDPIELNMVVKQMDVENMQMMVI